MKVHALSTVSLSPQIPVRSRKETGKKTTPTSDHEVAVAKGDVLCSEHDGLEARRTHLQPKHNVHTAK